MHSCMTILFVFLVVVYCFRRSYGGRSGVLVGPIRFSLYLYIPCVSLCVCSLEQVGDMLYLLNREPQQMIMGENIRTGDLGIFPASYVNILVPLP